MGATSYDNETLMNWLLLPEDELDLALHLTDALGLRLVSAIPTGEIEGAPRDLQMELPHDLPTDGIYGVPREFVFWRPSSGPIRLLGDRPDDQNDDVRNRVALRITKEASLDWRQFLDLQRTPIIRFHRCVWRGGDTLMPGLLQGMDLKVGEHPPEIIRLLRSISLWLKREGERLNPFDHCSTLPVPPPRNQSPFAVWARPAALAWVRAGGDIWPWTA